MKTEIIEKNLIAEIFLDNQKLDEIISFLKVKHFSSKENATIYKAMLDIYSSKQEIDSVTIFQMLKTNDLLEQAGGVGYISSIIKSDVFSSANTVYHAVVIREQYMKLQLANEASKIIEKVKDGKEDVFSIYSEAIQNLEDVIAESESGKEDKNLIDIIPQIFEEIDNERLGKVDNTVSLKTRNFPSFNRVTGGLRGGNLTVISGYFKKGKTTFANALMLDFVMQGINVGIFSLEMSANEMGMKSISMETATRYSYLRDPSKTGKYGQLYLNDERFLNVRDEAIRKFSDKKFIICDEPLNDQQIIAKIKHWKKKHNIQIVMIDYITLIESTRKFNRNDLEIAHISRQLKLIAKRTNLPLIVLSQENEAGDVAESKALSRDSDFWFSITHPIDDTRSESPTFKINGETIRLNQGHFVVTAKASRHSQNGLRFMLYFFEDGTFRELDVVNSDNTNDDEDPI